MKLTVIIPGFNTTQGEWDRCIDSVKRAIEVCSITAEIICVDDGSIDGAKFLDDRRDVIVIHQKKNQGPSVARNLGLNIAKGEWISFVDSDDIVSIDTYKNAITEGERIGSDVVVFGVTTIWPSIRLQKDDVVSNLKIGKMSPDFLTELKKYNLLNYGWNKLYRRKFLKENKIFFQEDTVMGEDLIFNLSCSVKNAQWGVISYIGYTYFRNKQTLLSRYIPKYKSGLMHTKESWRMYNEYSLKEFGESVDVFDMSDEKLAMSEWRNIWMPGTPYSLGGKWHWLKAHPEIGGSFEFIRMFIFTILKKWLYIRPIRRWHIKRLYPKAYDI